MDKTFWIFVSRSRFLRHVQLFLDYQDSSPLHTSSNNSTNDWTSPSFLHHNDVIDYLVTLIDDVFPRTWHVNLETLFWKLWACCSFFELFCNFPRDRGVAANFDSSCATDPPLSSKPECQLSRGSKSRRFVGRSSRIKNNCGSSLPIFVFLSICAVCCMWRRVKLWSVTAGVEKWAWREQDDE